MLKPTGLGSLVAGLVGEGNPPALRQPAPQRRVRKCLLNDTPVDCIFPGGDQERGEAGVVSQGFEYGAVDVRVTAFDLAIAPPLALQLAKLIPTANDLAVEHKVSDDSLAYAAI